MEKSKKKISSILFISGFLIAISITGTLIYLNLYQTHGFNKYEAQIPLTSLLKSSGVIDELVYERAINYSIIVNNYDSLIYRNFFNELINQEIYLPEKKPFTSNLNGFASGILLTKKKTFFRRMFTTIDYKHLMAEIYQESNQDLVLELFWLNGNSTTSYVEIGYEMNLSNSEIEHQIIFKNKIHEIWEMHTNQ
jgi:hypothetical protein